MISHAVSDAVANAGAGARLDERIALELAKLDAGTGLRALGEFAAGRRDAWFGERVTYSPKVFIPLTRLCRDVCHYCTFAKTPSRIDAAYMSLEAVVAVARTGAAAGCVEALFTLGDRPEARYPAARRALEELGQDSTLSYLELAARTVSRETGLLPHLNPGVMSRDDLIRLREVSVSMGLMLESASARLCERGGPHFGSPDKHPEVRLRTLADAGRLDIPMTTGMLMGIGENALERVQTLLAVRALHEAHGHIQEFIVQNFRAKPDTLMAEHPEPALAEHLWTIALARLILPPDVSVQAPPNLQSDNLEQLVAAGINDWGGVSPVTPDHVNPEAPWPHLAELEEATSRAGKNLAARLPIYPGYSFDMQRWVHASLHPSLLEHSDAEGLARDCLWSPGETHPPPPLFPATRARAASLAIAREPDEAALIELFTARGATFGAVLEHADALRAEACGDAVSYVVNRNINYTNVCYFRCRFCAFSKGKLSDNLRGRPYDLPLDEIVRRTEEAWQRGATEVCLQGGIHPEYTGQTYLDIVHAIKEAVPDIHVHAFTPLEVWQGATTLGMELEPYLRRLKQAGLGSLPGTAAEILDDEVRRVICPDKVTTEQWLTVMETAHRVGLQSTATIMFGHVDRPRHWARHLLRVRDLAKRTGGFTELVPLPFVPMHAPLYLRGEARRGPTYREAVLMHAAARIALHPHVRNIQASWVKLGERGVRDALAAGANDLGGTLMNESITRAAGAAHGEEWPPEQIEQLVLSMGRTPRLRTTLYASAIEERRAAALAARPLQAVVEPPARRYERGGSTRRIRPGLEESTTVHPEPLS